VPGMQVPCLSQCARMLNYSPFNLLLFFEIPELSFDFKNVGWIVRKIEKTSVM
jgi:hypothetical protein